MKALLFGATGAVGTSCLDILTRQDDVAVTLGGRDEVRLRDLAASIPSAHRVDVIRLDVTDTAAVAAAARTRDVVINCAGPSQRFSAAVAGAVIGAGVPYVDPGGDHALIVRIAESEPAVPVLLQAGVQPGLSGLVLRLLDTHRPDECAGITVWCGGLQPLTPASVLEYLASLGDSFSHPNCALRGGVVERVGRAELIAAPAPHFSASATVRPHLDAETVAVAEQLGIGDVLWLNVFDGTHTTRAMQLLALDDQRGADLDGVLAAAKLDLFGRQPYFAVVGNTGKTTVAVTCPDSYRVTGALTAFAARDVTGMTAGVRPFCSIEQPQRVLDFLTEAVPGVEIACVDDSVPPLIEEGLL
ncbi:saccharopine dehydrogenase NADP-binding domain-containing protein [Mycobacterium sp. TY814]|uniref:saccharopine dehydrogenase NADP-binding domain-containing protein n=1 Tax=unclassified Mycobacterium TaxID=2642494 RepID=UPI0027423CE2|nr:saccharopine dehydrogenase NADP-binding domain-containing protein [Mycobacterium sp. TY814]MDP7723727.1 saccharopine dehydrogenase NADP-binding domain-containing protein [Mycobacterium sp. TY814]